ncbi:hypothetical protein M885DRAFT_513370 [Pelagophyceae sp. CCMP2097]|nr:hypothetical protein M885DRAFT_513370 [Pelagophyceae sp. CCMP2097]
MDHAPFSLAEASSYGAPLTHHLDDELGRAGGGAHAQGATSVTSLGQHLGVQGHWTNAGTTSMMGPPLGSLAALSAVAATNPKMLPGAASGLVQVPRIIDLAPPLALSAPGAHAYAVESHHHHHQPDVHLSRDAFGACSQVLMVVDDEDVAHAMQQQQHEARPRPHNSGGVSPEHHASGKGGKTKNDYQKKYRSSDKGKAAQKKAQEKYRKSDKGKQAQTRARKKWREAHPNSPVPANLQPDAPPPALLRRNDEAPYPTGGLADALPPQLLQQHSMHSVQLHADELPRRLVLPQTPPMLGMVQHM